MTGIVTRCALAPSGHATAKPPSRVNSRRPSRAHLVDVPDIIGERKAARPIEAG
jgi:hypothetical protein